MTRLLGAIILIMAIASMAYADKGLYISNNTQPSDWPTTSNTDYNSLANKIQWSQMTIEGSTNGYASGYSGVVTVGTRNYFATQSGIYFTTWNDLPGTWTSTCVMSFGNNYPEPMYEAKVRAVPNPSYGSGLPRGYFVRSDWVIGFPMDGSSGGSYTRYGTKTSLGSSDGVTIADVAGIPSGNGKQVRITLIMTSTAAGSTTTWWQGCNDDVTRSSADNFYGSCNGSPAVLTSQSKCFLLFYDSDVNKFYTACSSLVLYNGVNSRSITTSSMTTYPTGAGDLTSGALVTSSVGKFLYLGSTLGLAFEIEVSTFTVKRVTLLFSGGNLSPFSSVIAHTPASTGLTALYWGTSDGQIARVNLRDFNVFSSDRLASAEDMKYLYTGTSSSTSNTIYAAGSMQWSTSAVKYFHSTSVSLTDCSIYSCSDCLANTVDKEYCGYCPNSGTCTLQGACATGWTQSGICPAGISLTPNNGSTAGGTTVVYKGSYFSTADSAKLFCKWGNNAETAPVSGSVTASTISCTSPSGLSGTQQLKIRYRMTDNTFRDYSGPLNFNFYNCASFGTCATCNSPAYPECGWCVATAACTASAGCSRSTSLEWQTSTCPSTGAITNSPAYARVDSLASVRVTVAMTNFPSAIAPANIRCKFSGPQTSTPTTATANSGSVVTCPMPTTLTTTDSALYTVSLTNSGGTQIAPSSTSSFQIFNCPGLNACFECSGFDVLCTWCVSASSPNASTCSTSTTCPGGLTANDRCAALYSATPDKLSLAAVPSGVQYTFTGADLNSADAALTTCYWNLGSSTTIKSNIQTPRTDTSAVCIVPSTITAGNWSVSLGNSFSRQTAQFPLFVYNCAAFGSCGTCVTDDHVGCDWCQDIDGPGCSDTTHSSYCSTWLTARNSCPSLASVFPTVLPISGGNVTLKGDHRLSAANASDVVCKFTDSTDLTHFVPLVYNSSDASFECTAPSAVAGTVTVALTSSHNTSRATYTNALSVDFVTCSQFTDCSGCLAGNDFCRWCGATCKDSASCATSIAATTCPVVSSIDPTVSVVAGGERITITGENFLTGGSKRQLLKEDFEEENNNNNNVAGEMTDATLRVFGFQTQQQQQPAKLRKLKRSLPYVCNWGSTNTIAEVDATGTHLYCDTPPQSGDGIVPLTVLFDGEVYLTTPGITFFRCGPGLDVCDYGSCTQTEHCGWCVADKSCGSLSQCKIAENTETPVWQSECPAPSLSVDRSPLSGNVPISITLSIGLPASTPLSEIQCQFGEILVPALSINTATVGNISTSTITCQAPSSSQARETSLSVLYRGNKLASDSTFSYDDCSIYKSDCTRCVSVSYCGWCGKSNKCTMQIECAADWAKNKCPVNKVAIGVGVGLGSFFFLLALLAILFLVRRARNKAGLIITLREPNYEEIAWGNDTTLAWKVPADNYKVLENHLNRRDFLLQVAIAFNCPATEQDALAKAMVYVASAHGLAADLIQTCIRYEVSTCLHENTLFRNNSVASKMYKFFSRIVGIKYLFNCIARVILELEVLGRKQMGDKQAAKEAQAGPNEVSLLSMSMELDQTKALGDDIDTDTNLLQLQLICQKLMNVLIKTSVKNIPAPFRKIFIEIDNSVMGRFAGSNDAVYKGIGGLFFLRFVCPAITAPHVYGLLESPPNVTTQRQLVLISKVIQNIANMQPPGKKEEYMTALNDFIVQAIPKIIKFYDNLRQAVNLDNSSSEDEQVLTVPEEVRLNGLAAIANFLHMEKNKLRKWTEPDDCPIDHMQKEDLNTILREYEDSYPSAPKKLKGTADEAMAGGQEKKKKKKRSKE